MASVQRGDGDGDGKGHHSEGPVDGGGNQSEGIGGCKGHQNPSEERVIFHCPFTKEESYRMLFTPPSPEDIARARKKDLQMAQTLDREREERRHKQKTEKERKDWEKEATDSARQLKEQQEAEENALREPGIKEQRFQAEHVPVSLSAHASQPAVVIQVAPTSPHASTSPLAPTSPPAFTSPPALASHSLPYIEPRSRCENSKFYILFISRVSIWMQKANRSQLPKYSVIMPRVCCF
jgi:hypothetical protein